MNALARLALSSALLFALPPDIAQADESSSNELSPTPVAAIEAIPDNTELERRHARIGHIYVNVEDVFEQTEHLSAPYRVVNRLHIATHDSTILQQLLFASGDPFDRRVLDETERLLRDQRYLNDASIEALHYNDDNTVDVVVRVHDVWTLSPGFSFGRKGGENSAKLKFEDTNLMGLGKQLSLARTQDVDRSAWRMGYADPQVFGSRWRMALTHSTMSDGADDQVQILRPFYSLDTRWSADLTAYDTSTTQSRYSLGELSERFNMRERFMELGGGISSGLHEGWTKRLLFGVRYDDRQFARPFLERDVVLPEDRRFVYPYVGLQWIEDAFVRTHNLDQIGRTEDMHLGRSLSLSAGFASSAFGSTSDALLLAGGATAGAQLADDQFIICELEAQTRVEGGAARNTQVDLGTRYYLRRSERRVLFASMAATWSSKLDQETQLMLGGDNGLRGYPLRYQAGTSRALFTVEERFYTKWQPLKLANVGAAIFVDAGRMWGRDDYAPPPSGWLSDIGVGLRLGSVRSGLGNILHVDLSFPLTQPTDIEAMQLTIETKKAF